MLGEFVVLCEVLDERYRRHNQGVYPVSKQEQSRERGKKKERKKEEITEFLSRRSRHLFRILQNFSSYLEYLTDNGTILSAKIKKKKE